METKILRSNQQGANVFSESSKIDNSNPEIFSNFQNLFDKKGTIELREINNVIPTNAYGKPHVLAVVVSIVFSILCSLLQNSP